MPGCAGVDDADTAYLPVSVWMWCPACDAAELKASVSFDDARRAVSEAKQHAKAKAAALLQSSNKTWSDKLAAARADAQLLHEQLQDMQLQRDQLAQQVS